MNMMKVCCFCERWESGGIESFLYNVLMQLNLTHIQIDIVAASMGESIFTQPLRQHGVKFYELSGKQRSIFKNHRLFARLMRTQKYDVIHLNIFHGLSLHYARLAKQSGIPIRIAHSHNTALRQSAGKLLKLLLHHAAKELFVNSATDLWACSKSAAIFLFSKEALQAKGFQFIPNGIDTGRFRFNVEVREAVRMELGLIENFVLGNIGRLCYQKNQSFLLDVFAELVNRNPKSRLLLVGEGEDRPKLEAQADQLGIADKVIFYGVSSHTERLLWAMDVFVFPSRFEGLGIAAIEAQAAGLPTICSEYVPDEAKVTGWVKTIPLIAGAHAWADTLFEEISVDRTKAVQAVLNSGFDVSDVAVRVVSGWAGEKAGETYSRYDLRRKIDGQNEF